MIRNFLFSIFFYLGIILISIIFLPSFFLPKKIVLFGGKLMGYWTGICLKNFLSTKIIIKGKENLINNEKFFIASSHQSMFETFFLQTIFNSPIFILKKELLTIPIFGWYLIKIDSISINRGKTTKENLNFFEKISKLTNKSNRPLVIFPQGTRLPPDDRSPFKKGAGRIYDELKIKCQPVAIDSGYIWPKNRKLKPNLTLTISILKPIEAGMNKEKFLEILQNEIYTELDSLN
jgi:1-acyl-sn-glycerol-3-phosphate acyltransferase